MDDTPVSKRVSARPRPARVTAGTRPSRQLAGRPRQSQPVFQITQRNTTAPPPPMRRSGTLAERKHAPVRCGAFRVHICRSALLTPRQVVGFSSNAGPHWRALGTNADLRHLSWQYHCCSPCSSRGSSHRVITTIAQGSIPTCGTVSPQNAHEPASPSSQCAIAVIRPAAHSCRSRARASVMDS